MAIPPNYWAGNTFTIPGLLGGTVMPRGFAPLDLSLFNPDGTLKTGQSNTQGILQTSGVALPSYVTEGRSHNRGEGPALGIGPGEFGPEAGKSATQDVSTTSTTSLSDWGKSALTGMNPGLAAIGVLANMAMSRNEPDMSLRAAAQAAGRSLFGNDTPSNTFGGGLLAGQSGEYGPDNPNPGGVPSDAGPLAGQSGAYGPDDPTGTGGGGGSAK